MSFRGGGRGGGARGGARGGRGAPRGGRGGGDRGRGGFSRGGGRGGGRGGPRGGARGGRGGVGKGRGGARGGAVTVTPHRHPGVFLAHSKGHDEIVTKSVAPGISVYMEKRFTTDIEITSANGEKEIEKAEFRYWNPFRSKLCAAIVSGIADTYIKPGSKVLYLGAASGTTVSHVADMVGDTGMVIAVEFAERPGVDLLNMTSKRRRVAPVVADARKPDDYRMMVPGMVDCIFADVAQPDPVRIVALNASRFLKHGGGVLITIKANCIDSTVPPAKVYASQVELMKQMGLKPKEQLDLGQFQRGHALIVGQMNAQDLKASATGVE